MHFRKTNTRIIQSTSISKIGQKVWKECIKPENRIDAECKNQNMQKNRM